jgi:hypothetical protein
MAMGRPKIIKILALEAKQEMFKSIKIHKLTKDKDTMIFKFKANRQVQKFRAHRLKR